MTNYVIIGTGAAGIAAAEAIRQRDPEGRIMLIGEEPDGYYSRPGLAYILTGELPESQLFPYSREDFVRQKLQFVNAAAVRIDTGNQRIRLDNGATVLYDFLLLATGAYARASDLPGTELPGVVQLDNISNAREILQRAKKARTAVVIGGGITALELVEGLLSLNLTVHYFLRGDRYWGNVLDETESKIVEHRLAEEGVTIHYNTEAEEILPARAGLFGNRTPRVGGVRTVAGEEIRCDLVAVAIGVIPRTELAENARLEIDRGVLVDEGMRTSDPRIFAAGDVAQAYDPSVGRKILDVLWPVARDQGRVAGINMSGGDAVYQKAVPLNVTRLAGLTTTIIGTVNSGGVDKDTIGIVRGDSETWRSIPDALSSQQGFAVNRIRLMLGEKHILGAIIMGDQKLSSPVYEIIRRKMDISDIRDALLSSGNISELLAEFWERVCPE